MKDSSVEAQFKALSDSRSRRRFMTRASLAAVGAGVLGATKLSKSVSAQAVTDADILNFALNLEYLEAEFYLRAVTGAGLSAGDVTGSGTPGNVIVKSGSTVVPFATEAIRQYAVEIAADELAHVKFIRAALTSFGFTPVARPTIDLRDSFTAAAKAAGIISSLGPGPGTCPPGFPPSPRPASFFVPTRDCLGWVPMGHPLAIDQASGPTTFDPFADELSFLLGAFIFEDVGVTAYKGAARLLTNPDILEAAAGLLAVEAYHAGAIRAVLFSKGASDATQKISDLRDGADGPGDTDQGIVLNNNANLVPTDANGLAFSRTAAQVLSIVYLGTATGGGFFPNKVNGLIA
jgi:hypothetical protein